ncbi:hypothetical protein UR09_05090, partial [Candidatus Nitromaritima sp. SCGC AAA799-A02]
MVTAVSIGAGVVALVGFFLWLFQKGKALAVARYLEDENRKLERIHEERKNLLAKHEIKWDVENKLKKFKIELD